MAQPNLTLRPPPNVDFVHGYPGIPPGTDRPQAAVKGAIEVRVGQQGVKAKWVRIELRKIETLPGGGVTNTFFDFVGQSPINLWQSANEEYSTLHTNDFPFFIRIPESIPPTIALEKGAGIKYELIASVCVQGKKGFLRRDKPVVTATASTIIIDKHELHSTWPIYSQPETRNQSQDGVTLVVERAHTCYGPGDRVVVMAIVKSDTLHTVILRGFEFVLRETTIFRAAPHTQSKKGSPQVKVSSIGEQKVPVNATLYGGTQHKAELSVTVPSHHTSATINAARHIDINYVLIVKALMGTGQPIVMELPIMISNWPRAVSVEAMRRIGHAFNVSVPNHPPHQQVASPPSQSTASSPTKYTGAPIVKVNNSHGYSNSIDQKPPPALSPPPPKVLSQTAPPLERPRDRVVAALADEFGVRKDDVVATQTIGAYGGSGPVPATGPIARARAVSAASSNENGSAISGASPRPRSSTGRGVPQQRLTIVNASEEEMREQLEAEAERARRQPSTILESPVALSPPAKSSPTFSQKMSASGPGPRWPSAEEEKERLYNRAVADVKRVQGRVPTDTASQNGNADAVSLKSPTPVSSSSKPHNRWPTADEEKAQLFEQAQRAVARAHAGAASASAGGSSSAGAGGSTTRAPSMSAGAALYSEAMSAINKPVSPAPVTPMASPQVVSPTPIRQSTGSAMPSASDEKAMLARYYEAKNAVWQTHSAHYGQVPGNAMEPVSYDSTHPNQQQASSPAPSQSQFQPQSPPAATPSPAASSHLILSEKERLRRHYEAQDAAAAQPQQQPSWQPGPPQEDYASSPPPEPYPAGAEVTRFSSLYSAPPTGGPPPFAASPATPMSAYAEKEMLRRRYEEQDALSSPAARPTPTPPPRSSTLMNGRGRPPPTPPISPQATPGTPLSSRPLTAVEEKARLRAMYEAEDRGPQAPAYVPGLGQMQSPYPSPPPSNGFHAPNVVGGYASVPPPPPLAPKPPREYIEETRAEDARTTAKLSAIDAAGPDLALAEERDEIDGEDEEAGGADVEEMDVQNSTFGPGALAALSAGPGSKPGTPGPGPSRSSTLSPPGTPLAVPPPPPLPPKVLIE